jgi:DNA repair protein RecN (Recombination protein N)
MLTELHVCQFALIEEARLAFQPGMTVLTGETGAGKSILVDALGAVFGARAEREWVRHGAEYSEITAVIEDVSKPVWSLLETHGIEADEQLILRRLITADGRSRAYVNGRAMPLKVLQQLGSRLLDQHGQHEHQALLQSGFQCGLLDERLPAEKLSAVQTAFKSWQHEKQMLADLLAKGEEGKRQELWMRDELQRLKALELEPGIEEQLRNQVESGRHFAQIHEAAGKSLMALEDGDINVRSLLAQCEQALRQAAAFRPELEEDLDLLEQMDALLSELEPHLRAVWEEAFDPVALRQAEDRLMNLHDAMRRHDTDEAGLIHLLDEMESRISLLETVGWDVDAREKQLEAASRLYQEAASELTEARKQAAAELCRTLRTFMDQLALEGMEVRIRVEPMADHPLRWSASGWDEVEFMASSNTGEPFRPLSSIASGGELSRLVLALKGSGALKSVPDMAIFDEVDAGIGGETAWRVGELLASMGRERQVLVISHLPQVAACADWQIRIRKREHQGRTVTTFEQLELSERLEELARMLGGATSKSMEHAAQMLQRGEMGRKAG